MRLLMADAYRLAACGLHAAARAGMELRGSFPGVWFCALWTGRAAPSGFRGQVQSFSRWEVLLFISNCFKAPQSFSFPRYNGACMGLHSSAGRSFKRYKIHGRRKREWTPGTGDTIEGRRECGKAEMEKQTGRKGGPAGWIRKRRSRGKVPGRRRKSS